MEGRRLQVARLPRRFIGAFSQRFPLLSAQSFGTLEGRTPTDGKAAKIGAPAFVKDDG